jgi:hypothetical protein
MMICGKAVTTTVWSSAVRNTAVLAATTANKAAFFIFSVRSSDLAPGKLDGYDLPTRRPL